MRALMKKSGADRGPRRGDPLGLDCESDAAPRRRPPDPRNCSRSRPSPPASPCSPRRPPARPHSRPRNRSSPAARPRRRSAPHWPAPAPSGNASASAKPCAAATEALPVAIAFAPASATALALPASQALNRISGSPGTCSAAKAAEFVGLGHGPGRTRRRPGLSSRILALNKPGHCRGGCPAAHAPRRHDPIGGVGDHLEQLSAAVGHAPDRLAGRCSRSATPR